LELGRGTQDERRKIDQANHRRCDDEQVLHAAVRVHPCGQKCSVHLGCVQGPSYMGVIVSSSITQSGSTISGNTPDIVVVKTNSGYAPDPGHAGTGTVVAQVC
jgi:hypothetical protein